MAALLYLLVVLATLGAKLRRVSFRITAHFRKHLAGDVQQHRPWVIIALLAAGTVPPWLELYTHRKPLRVYTLHMIVFVGLLVGGQALLSASGDSATMSTLGAALLMAAVLVRSGIFPLHCWMTDLFEHASFGTALLFVTPMVGAYAAMRLVLSDCAGLAAAWRMAGSRWPRPCTRPAWRWCSETPGGSSATCF